MSKYYRRRKKAEISELGGVPTLFVNGVPKGPMTFQWGLEEAGFTREKAEIKFKQLKSLGDAGIEIFFTRISLGDPALVDSALSRFDETVSLLLEAVPEAYIIPWIIIWPYAKFGEKYPDEVITFDDGTTGGYTRPDFMGLKDPNTPRYTWASEVWKEETSGIISRLVRHINKASYRDHVIGYFFFIQCYETSYFWDWDHENRSIDYSPAMLRYFRKWLRKEYNNDVNALRRAWKDETVDFETAQLPSKEAKNRADFGFFWDPEKSRQVIDYFRCHAEAVASKVIHYARVVKRESQNKVICGFFYGYLQNQDYIYGGQSVFKGVLNADEVDFWSSPHTYENRGPGDHASFRFLIKTLKDHGRLWFAECDTFMHDTAESALKHHGYPKTTLEQTVEVLKRDFAYVLCEGVNGWWIDWSSGPSMYEKPLISLIKRMQQVSKVSLDYPRRSMTDIAAVVDQESILTTPYKESREVTFLTLDREKIHELPRIGSPVDFYELDDVLREDADKYKMYIFLNPFSIDTRERRLIKERLQRDGNTLVWIYAPGLINPDDSPALSLEHMKELTGISFNYIPKRQRARIKVENYSDPLTLSLPRETEFGDFERPVTSGFQMNRDTMEPIKLPPVMVNPVFYVEDPDAIVLGRFIQSGKPGFAVKRFEDWTSVYVGSLSVGSHILRAIAKAAGVHLYDEADDIIYANQSFLAIHTNKAGERIVNLPRKTDLYEVFDDQVLGRNINRLKLNLPAYTTKLIFMGNVDEFKEKLEKMG